jgi:hypothetical protein
VTAFTYQIPKFGTSKLVRNVVGGWMLGGVLRYASGNLIPVASSRTNMNTYTFNTNTRFDRVPGVPLFIQDPNCKCIDPNSNHLILNPAAWVDTAVGTWGSGSPYYSDYRWQRQATENLNLGREFAIHERMKLSVRAEFFNAFNRVSLPMPSNSNPLATPTFTSAGVPTGGFGFITNSSSIGGQRNGQLVARFVF